MTMPKPTRETTPTAGVPAITSLADEVCALSERARNGDENSLARLRDALADPIEGAALVEAFGSPAAWLEATLTKQAAGGEPAFEEAMLCKLDKVRAELQGPNPTAIERLLAERAAVCWFLVNRYEDIYARQKELTIKQAQHHQKRIDAAHRRFLAALRTLATVRKLALPAIQVNIARRQVNVAGSRPED